MRNLLFLGLLLLFAISAQAQQTLNFPIFRGNVGEQQILLPVVDSAKAVTAKAFYSQYGRLLPADLQPYVIRSASPGTSVIVRFERTSALPDVGWVEVYVSGQVRAAGRLIVTKSSSPVTTIPPTSIPGTSGSDGRQTPFIRVVSLENTASGFPISHGQNTSLVRADFFWTDTSQRDPVWSITIDSDNSVRVIGPPNERFFGQVVLEFYKK